MKQQIKKLNLRKQHVVYLMVFLLSGATILASKAPNLAIHAATSDYMYMSPASGSYKVGSTITITLRENSYTDTVNAAEADLSYPTSKLQFVSTTITGVSSFGIAAQNTGGSGSVTIAVGNYSALSGDKVIAVVKFKVLATGSAAVTYKNSSQVLSSTTNTNVISSLQNGSYTLAASTSPTPPPPSPTPPPPSPSPSPIGSTKHTTNTSKSSTPTTTIAPKNNPHPVTVPDNSNVELNQQATVQTTPTGSSDVTKVQYYLNNKLVATVTSAPYNYTVDTTDLRNGNYTLTTKTFYADGTDNVKNASLIVKNPFGWNQFRLQARHYFAFVVVAILLIGAGVWYLIQKRGDRYLDSHMNSPFSRSGSGGDAPTAHVGTM